MSPSAPQEPFNATQVAGVVLPDVPYLLEGRGVRKNFPGVALVESSCRFVREPSTL